MNKAFIIIILSISAMALLVSPPSTAQTSQVALTADSKAYHGKLISLNLNNLPIADVLKILAEENNLNLVTSDSVAGAITLNLQDVPWDQALEIVLQIKGLDKRLNGNILLVAPAEELAAQEAAALQSQQQVAQLAPLLTSHIRVNYAKAAGLADILKTSSGGILSERGSVTVDERTNTLLLRDTADAIAIAKATITSLDIPVRQVLIESRMVTVRNNFDEQLGVRWGLSKAGNNKYLAGSLEGASALAQTGNATLADRLNVNLPVANPAGRIGLMMGDIIDGAILDLELSALESENKGEIIASPRITVANQQEAYIEQGQDIPYVEASSSGATSVSFKKAVLSLKVVPQITPDNRIIMDLVVTQDTRGETVSTPTGPAVAIDTQEIKTQVLVNNGETIVLGGIFQQVSASDRSQVPVLGDIPVLGQLFSNNSVVNEKRELLIFVTPRIILPEN